MKKKIENITHEQTSKLTPLRQDILSILVKSKKPLTAYEILKLLKKKRPNAEPPTVYRVLEYLMKFNLVHRIESKNAYICCSSAKNTQKLHQSILLFCKRCEKSAEFEDSQVFLSLSNFVKNQHIQIDNSIIEFEGLCQQCKTKTHASL